MLEDKIKLQMVLEYRQKSSNLYSEDATKRFNNVTVLEKLKLELVRLTKLFISTA